MGYAFYEIPTPDGRPMKRGYGVTCKCHQRGCKEKIDRGLDYVCYSCTWYFCEDHLFYSPLSFECFAGKGNWICQACEKKKLTPEEEEDDVG